MLRRLFRRLLLIAAVVGFKLWLMDRCLVARRGSRLPRALGMLVVVDAPREETWAVISDIPLQPEWMREMKEVRLTTPGPVHAGTRGEATVRIAGISITDPVEVTAFEPPAKFAIRHEGLFKGGGLITLEPGAGDTTTIVRWEETLIPPLLPALGARVMAPVLRSIFQADLQRLKRLVETGSADD
jgi:uncharacterized membrane protein